MSEAQGTEYVIRQYYRVTLDERSLDTPPKWLSKEDMIHFRRIINSIQAHQEASDRLCAYLCLKDMDTEGTYIRPQYGKDLMFIDVLLQCKAYLEPEDYAWIVKLDKTREDPHNDTEWVYMEVLENVFRIKPTGSNISKVTTKKPVA